MAMRDAMVVVLTRNAANRIREAAAHSGRTQLHLSAPDRSYVVDRVEISSGVWLPVDIPREYTALRWGQGEVQYAGQWFRSARPELAWLHYSLRRRFGTSITFDAFRGWVPGVSDPGGNQSIVIVHHPEPAEGDSLPAFSEFTGWVVGRDGVGPVQLEVEPSFFGPSQLETNNAWPTAALAGDTVTIVGVGSIGSAAAVSLAELGVGRLNLVDYDRLLWHNVVRHRLGPESVGRYKVDALKGQLAERSRVFTQGSTTDVAAYRLDAVGQADVVHDLARNSNVVLCCADGIATRRAVNHVARIAQVPAIFACVLSDGRIGEVFRSRPGRNFGCLLCHRAWLSGQGAIDPEVDQEAAYGTGTTHKPMTAAPHDLAFVGTFAAKIAMATLLESRHGDTSQQLPSEHAVLGLRPDLPQRWPFDVSRSGEVVWNEVPRPRPDCATCSVA